MTASASSCSSTLASDVVACDGRMYDRDGYDMKWTIATAGEYTLTVSQPNVKYPIDPSLTVKDGTGKELAHNDGIAKGAEAKATLKLEPGTYSINVRDVFHDKVKGGYGFHLDIARSPDAPAPAASASITSADVKAPAAKAATPAVKGGPAKSAAPKAGAAPSAAAKPAATAKKP